jgi:hypothetical protein
MRDVDISPNPNPPSHNKNFTNEMFHLHNHIWEALSSDPSEPCGNRDEQGHPRSPNYLVCFQSWWQRKPQEGIRAKMQLSIQSWSVLFVESLHNRSLCHLCPHFFQGGTVLPWVTLPLIIIYFTHIWIFFLYIIISMRRECHKRDERCTQALQFSMDRILFHLSEKKKKEEETHLPLTVTRP